MEPALADKERELQARLRELGSLVVAYSGGVDSTLLSHVAFEVLGERMVALLGRSPSLAPREHAAALVLARGLELPLVEVETCEHEDPAFLANSPDRCFHCKRELLAQAWSLAEARGFSHVAIGANLDDEDDHRPGHRAVAELQAVSPLAETGFTKADVRALARHRGIPVWDKPAMPCLASRLPYGERITTAKLAQVNSAEEHLHILGFPVCRVRHHGDVARVEIEADQIGRCLDPDLRRQITTSLHEIGYRYVALDLDGFRSGSLNESL
jgi:uncharacterized protein